MKVQFQTYFQDGLVEDDEVCDVLECGRYEKAEQIQQHLIEETKRLVKVMGEIAVDLEFAVCIETIQGNLYDMEKKGPQKSRGGIFELSQDEEKFLSEAQLKMTPFAWWYAHPSPEELGSSFH